MDLYVLENANRVFDANFEGGTLTWKGRPRSDFKNDQAFLAWNTKYKGEHAGGEFNTPAGKTYLQIVHRGKNYMVHRILFMMFHERLPCGQIDHFDGDGANNSISNLREVTPSQNSRNMRRSVRNTSGVVGVYWCKNNSKWHARVTSQGKTKHVGFFSDLADAEAAVKKVRAESGFSASHGTDRPL